MKLLILLGLVGSSCANYWPVISAYTPVHGAVYNPVFQRSVYNPVYQRPVYNPAYYPSSYAGYPYYQGLSGLNRVAQPAVGVAQPAVVPVPAAGVAAPGSSVQFTGTGNGAFDVNGVSAFIGTGAAEWRGDGAGIITGFGNAQLDGRGRVVVGPGFGTFNDFDGSVGVQGTGALIAIGDGQSRFAGQGVALAAGNVRNAVIDGTGLTSLRMGRTVLSPATIPSGSVAWRNVIVGGLDILSDELTNPAPGGFRNIVNANFGLYGTGQLDYYNQKVVTGQQLANYLY